MSEPRHAMVFRCDKTKKWFLEMCPEPYDIFGNHNEDLRYRDAADTFGEFESAKEAQEFGYKNFQNTGYEIPIINLEFFVAPFKWIPKEKCHD
jgi:hypothetical protein|tara:strand:- start:39 stop:317 length:279 start_codon:yes stop_codon:yes gene_type:complete